MKKLSKAQIRLLQQMQEYDSTVTSSHFGAEPYMYLNNARGKVRGIRCATIYNLSEAGFLKTIKEDWRARTYALTEKAIEFLEKMRES